MKLKLGSQPQHRNQVLMALHQLFGEPLEEAFHAAEAFWADLFSFNSAAAS
jgi:hypothetical protein